MYKKPVILVLLAVVLFVQACQAQSKNIKNAWGFAKEMSYGKEIKDLEGNSITRRDTAYFFYIEVKGKNNLQIGNVLYNGGSFTASMHKVAEKETLVGINKATDKETIISKTSANSLWRVELTPGGMLNHHPTKNKRMTLQGAINGRPFFYTIKSIVWLQPDIVG